MWDITIHPLKEHDDSVGKTRQPVRSALIPNVTAWPNLLDIVCFGPYRPHRFVLGDHAWPQNTSDKLATSTTNKASNQLITRRCGILHLPPQDPTLIGPSSRPKSTRCKPSVIIFSGYLKDEKFNQ
jgi:hypothetical protein